MFDKIIEPTSLGVLTTMKCTATCDECCFECSPYRDETMNLEELKKIIDSIKEEFNSVKVIAWTGGESTLLGDDLIKAIRYAKSKDILSRLVTNAWWASSKDMAVNYLKKLRLAGLQELNISTGDNHIEYVPLINVILATISSAKMGIPSVISVERRADANISKKDIIEHPVFKNFLDENMNTNLVKVIDPVWVSFHSDNVYDYEKLNLSSQSGGCNTIFEVLSISKNKGLSLCCGLSLDYIPAMQLDKFQSFCENPKISKENFLKSFEDLLKIWIYTDGPYSILKKAKEYNDEIEIPKYIHKCLYCSYIYNNDTIKSTLIDNYAFIKSSILKRFNNKRKWKDVCLDIL